MDQLSEGDDVQSVPSTPATPGAPFFIGLKQPQRSSSSFRKARRSLVYRSSSNCFGVESWPSEDGSFPTADCPLPPPISLARKLGAEIVGTFILVFAGAATSVVNQKNPGSVTLPGLAASNGLAVMIIILSAGHISGAHLNPSVTIAFAALRHFSWKHVPMYIGAQAMGSVFAAFTVKGVFHPAMSGGATVPAGSFSQAFALEFLISFILMFVVTAVATDTRAVGELAALAVGATVMLNVLVSGEFTGASMNPVRTLGPAIAANNFRGIWIYFAAPTLGMLCGAGIYSAVKLPDETGESIEKPSSVRSFRG